MSVRLPAKFFRRALASLLGLVAMALAPGATTTPAPASATPGTAFVAGFRLPGFGDDGYKLWEIQGREAQAAAGDTSTVQITDMTLLRYKRLSNPAGQDILAIESSIACAHATVRRVQDKTLVSSPEKLYIYDGANNSYNASGNDWTWDGSAAQPGAAGLPTPVPTIHIGQNVYVQFTAAASAKATTAAANVTAPPANPVIILSDKLDIYQQESDNRFVFTGNVIVKNGESQTTCQWLEVLAQRSAEPNPVTPVAAHGAPAPVSLGVGHVERILARDSVVVRQGDLQRGDFEASGGAAELIPSEQSVILTESPQIHALESDTLLQGGRIVWQQDQQVMQVYPPENTPTAPGRVSVSLPPLASYQKDAPPPTPGGPRLVITGESLVARFGEEKPRFDVEKSVHIEDPSLRVNAEHLDAEFAAKTAPAAAAVPATTLVTTPDHANSLSQMGKLDHLTVQGGVTIFQDKLTTTTPQAEILPATKAIVLNDGPHIMDGESHAEIFGGRITLFNDGQNGLVESTAGHPATLLLPSLRGPAEIGGPNPAAGNTTVVSETVAMQRGTENSTFTFNQNVHVTAKDNDFDSTCGELIVTTNNMAAKPGDDPLAASVKFGQITELEERDQVVVSQGAYQARAARAEIYPQVKITLDDAASGAVTTPTQSYRLVQLFSSQAGVSGLVRPEVVIPLKQEIDLTPLAIGDAGTSTVNPPSAPASAVHSTAKITSDEQWLMTSPAGDTYYFKGNVVIVTDTFTATCDQMSAKGTAPASATDPAQPPAKVSLERIIAEGQVTIKQSSSVATAGRAEILPGEHTATLSDNVIVVDEAKHQTLHDANVILNLNTGDMKAVTPPAVPGQPVTRPNVTVQGSTSPFDNLLKHSDKPAARTSP